MQRQLAALASAVRDVTSQVVGGGSTEQQQRPASEEDPSTSVVPLLLWRLLLGADTVPARTGGSTQRQAWPAAGPHAQLLQRMGAALGVSVGPEGVLTQEHSSTTLLNGQAISSTVWQPCPAHASAAQLLHLACCLAPHTPQLMACTADPSLPPSQPQTPDAPGPKAPSTPLLLGRCMQLGVQLVAWAGALVGVCELCGGAPGQALVSHWPGWSSSSCGSAEGGTAASRPGSSKGACASPLWLLLSDVAALAARVTAGLAPPEAAAATTAAEEGAESGHVGATAGAFVGEVALKSRAHDVSMSMCFHLSGQMTYSLR